MHHTFGLNPDLHPDSNEMKRYTSYVNHDDDKKHIGLPGEQAAKATIATFKGLRSYIKEDRLPSANRTLQFLAFQILSQEIRILSPIEKWSGYREPSRSYAERLQARVESGRSSFLYIHGRDGKSTGFDEFDKMYQDVWRIVGHFSMASAPQQYRDLTEQHRLHVVDTELDILGHLVLGTYQK